LIRCSSEPDVESCLAGAFVSPDAGKVLSCLSRHSGNPEAAALCTLGDTQLSEDAARVVSCGMRHSSVAGFGACAAGDELSLTEDQQIALECVATTGGEPTSSLSCYGWRSTVSQLKKCFTHGIGGEDGCFGENNEIVKLARNAWNGLEDGYDAIGELRDELLPPNDKSEHVQLLRNPGKRTLEIGDSWVDTAEEFVRNPGKTVVDEGERILNEVKNELIDKPLEKLKDLF